MASHLREVKKNLEEQIKRTKGDLALAVIEEFLVIVDAAIADIEAHTEALKPVGIEE